MIRSFLKDKKGSKKNEKQFFSNHFDDRDFLCAGLFSAFGQSALDGFDPNANNQVRSIAVQADGKILAGGISNVRVLMTNQTGENQSAVSNTFGNFRFETVAAGEIYVFRVQGKRYQFSVPSQVLCVNGNNTELAFIADWKSLAQK
jgi:hypothetical protein